MDTRLTTGRGLTWLLGATIVALGLLLALAATASAASPTACRVRNADTGKTYTALQAAVDAARRRDRLTVRGICRGTTVIDLDVVIAGVRGQGSAGAILHGHDQGVTVTVPKGVTVTISDVEIIRGQGRLRRGGPERRSKWPAGIENRGHLTLMGVLVRWNQGVGVENLGSLRLKGDSVIGNNGYWNGNNEFAANVHNRGTVRLNGNATVRGYGGVRNEGVLVLNGASRITNSQVANSGTLILNDASQFGNTWPGVENSGSMTLNDASRIIGYLRDGEISSYGGGVINGGSLTLNDRSLIRDLHVAVANSGTFIMNDDSRVSHNGDSRYEASAAVHNLGTGTLILNGTSQINDNWMGVENQGSITLNGSSSIRDNHRMKYSSDCPHWCPPTPRLVGAGVSNKGSLTLNDSSSITGNSAAESGAGVYLWEGTGASLTMTGSSTISGNTTGKTGGGVYAGAGSTLTGVSCGPQTYANVYGNAPNDCVIE